VKTLDRLFRLTENRVSVRTELAAGLTTFMTVAYLLAVNPAILSAAGMPRGGVFVATALAAFVGTALMALLGNYPFVLAAGMGLNAYFAHTVVRAMGYSWSFALLAVFAEGLIFLALSLCRVREALFNAIPMSLKRAATVGIGLFLVLVALRAAGVMVSDPETGVRLLSFRTAPPAAAAAAVLALAGTLLTAVLHARRVPGAILLGILLTWALGAAAEVAGLLVPDPAAGHPSAIPRFPGGYLAGLRASFADFSATCGALFDPASWTHAAGTPHARSGWTLLASADFLSVLFAFLFVDLFDTLATLVGLSANAGLLDDRGRLPRVRGALCADALATVAGAVFGTSTNTTVSESAAGVAAGGRTGLTALAAAVLFLLAIPLAPLFLAIPAYASAPALVVVGYLMASSVVRIDFADPCEGIPAFLCIVAMPFFGSIADGIMFGVVSYAALNLLAGRPRRVSPAVALLALLFLAKYALL